MLNRTTLPLAALLLLAALPLRATSIEEDGEYYIRSDYYDMVLGVDSSYSSTPALSAYGTVADTTTYIFVAEASSTDGCYYLRNKGTGQYLTASTSNSWSLVWADEKSESSQYLWALDVQMGQAIVSQKNTSKRLGSDWSEDDFVKVYYNKSYNSLTRFTVVPALEEGYEASLKAAVTEEFTNDIGRQEIDIWQINGDMDFSDDIDVHIMSDEPFADGGTINIGSSTTWLIFENVRPSEIVDSLIAYITYLGNQAKVGSNVRVAIYLDGAAVIPWKGTETAFTGYSGEQYTGTETKLKMSNYTTINTYRNTFRSFILKRGYMATLYTETDNGGYSRVYVADHEDMCVPVLPDALNQRISSIWIKEWQYTSKKGWCSTEGSSSIATKMAKLNATWFYTWSADRSNTDDTEYVPHRCHIYWPSVSTIKAIDDATHVLSFNEPEHSEQHDSEDCTCGGTISAWSSCTYTPDLAACGMRVGSPAPTDASYLTSYCTYVDNMAYRCDFVAFHAYWGPDEADGADAWESQLKAIYTATGRPIWLTEWAFGASWTNLSYWGDTYSEKLEDNREAIFDIVNKLEELPYVERYAYYQWDLYYQRFITDDDGWVTPAGRVYRDTKSTFSFNQDYVVVPNWWQPSTKTPSLTASVDDDETTATFTIVNTNNDYTETLILEKYNDTTAEWDSIWSVEKRYYFDDDTLTYSISMEDVDRWNDQYRVSVTTVFGNSATSNIADLGYITNPDCADGTTGWTVSSLSTLSGEAYDDDDDNIYWNIWTSGGLNSSMRQTVTGLPEGDYTVSALLRGSSVATLTLSVDHISAQEGTTTNHSVSANGVGNSTQEGSDYYNGWMLFETDTISVYEGDTLVITASAYATSSAWWSADHFRLSYTYRVPTAINDVEADGTNDTDSDGPVYLLDGRQLSTEPERGVFIRNGQKYIKH